MSYPLRVVGTTHPCDVEVCPKIRDGKDISCDVCSSKQGKKRSKFRFRKGMVYVMRCPHCRGEAHSPEHGSPYQCGNCNWSSSPQKMQSTNKQKRFKSMYTKSLGRWVEKGKVELGESLAGSSLSLWLAHLRDKKNPRQYNVLHERASIRRRMRQNYSDHKRRGQSNREGRDNRGERRARERGKISTWIKKAIGGLGSNFKTTHSEKTPFLSSRVRTISSKRGTFRVHQLRDVKAGKIGRGESFRIYATPRTPGGEAVTAVATGHGKGKVVGRNLYHRAGLSTKPAIKVEGKVSGREWKKPRLMYRSIRDFL